MALKPRLRPAAEKAFNNDFIGTACDLAKVIYGHPTCVKRILKELHKEKAVRIFDWVKGVGSSNLIPSFCKYDGKPDEKKPVPMTSEERKALYREKQRALRPKTDGARKSLVSFWWEERRNNILGGCDDI